MKEKIIYDCDMVLLDWYGGFRTFLKDLDAIDVSPGLPANYDMLDWVGVDDKDFIRDRIVRFNSGELGQFENLKPIDGAVEGVNLLRSAGFTDSVLTCCDTRPGTVRGRIANLQRVFGGFDDVTCLDLGESKLPSLLKRSPSWFVEDNLQNAHDGVTAGHSPVLINYPHNAKTKTPELFARVNFWGEIVDLINTPDFDIASGY